MRSGSEAHPRPGVPRGICARDMRPVPDPVFHVEHAEERATWAYTSRGVAGQTSSQPSQPSRPTPTSYSSRALPSGPAQTLARVVCGLASPQTFRDQIASRSSGRRCPQITSRRHAGCAPVALSRPSGAPASPQPARELAGRSVASAARSRFRFRQGTRDPARIGGMGQLRPRPEPSYTEPRCPRLIACWQADPLVEGQISGAVRMFHVEQHRCWGPERRLRAKQRLHVRTAGAWRARRRVAGTGQGTGE
jgi:hypothetical protein